MISSISEFRFASWVLCRVFNCSETSGHRTAERNAQVGGSEGSQHLIGGGMDLVPTPNTKEQRARVKDAAEALGLWALDETHHVHIQIARRFIDSRWRRADT